MTPSRSGGVWGGTWGGGVCHVGEGTRPRCYGAAEGLSSGTVRAIYEDQDGSVWIGSSGGGLKHLQDYRIETFGAAAGFSKASEVLLIAPARNGGGRPGGCLAGPAHLHSGDTLRNVLDRES